MARDIGKQSLSQGQKQLNKHMKKTTICAPCQCQCESHTPRNHAFVLNIGGRISRSIIPSAIGHAFDNKERWHERRSLSVNLTRRDAWYRVKAWCSSENIADTFISLVCIRLIGSVHALAAFYSNRARLRRTSETGLREYISIWRLRLRYLTYGSVSTTGQTYLVPWVFMTDSMVL